MFECLNSRKFGFHGLSGFGLDLKFPTILYMGDLNARVAGDNPNFVNVFHNVLGNFGEDMKANGNGKKLLDFCQSSGLSITYSFFKHKKIHMYSWENRDQNQKSLLDYVNDYEDTLKFWLGFRSL